MSSQKQPQQFVTKRNTILLVIQNCIVASLSLSMFYNALLPVEDLILITYITFIIINLYSIYKSSLNVKKYVSNSELKALRSQMNPHFIFNSLNSINSFITKNEGTQASDYLKNFAKLMRMILINSEKKSIPLADELNILELYMKLESRRLDDKFNYQIKIADDIDEENTLVPPMILQPFVENSIWHGIANKEGKGNILIDISKNSHTLHCIIDDDGIGRNKTEVAGRIKNQISLGMKITKARIDIINKTKNSKENFELFDLANGMRVHLNFPFELSF